MNYVHIVPTYLLFTFRLALLILIFVIPVPKNKNLNFILAKECLYDINVQNLRTALLLPHAVRNCRTAAREGAGGREASSGKRSAAFSVRASNNASGCTVMREAAGRMAELEFEAPLAQIEEADDCLSTADYPQKTINGNDIRLNNIKNIKSELVKMKTDSNKINDNEEPKPVKCKQDNMPNGEGDNFTETFSGSLEDLVNTFDEKITKCFGNYEESVEKLAPVQVRSQEEIMNECQMWWTITGNFGNILPIDWTKSFSRKMHIPTLNLNEKKSSMTPDDEIHSSEDEAVASDLDMHALILGGLHQDHECPVKTADEVIQEIDDMMQDTPSSEGDIIEYNEALEKGKEVLSAPLYEDKLRTYSLAQLNEIFMELEVLIREFSETLIAELALRDELEYEKELKNTFISLLLAVQNKRRQYHIEKKKRPQAPRSPNLGGGHSDSKYLTTVIPFHLDNGPPDNQSLQVLIKILKAINEDSPTVPTLLTDYILKVLCPT